MTRHGEPLGAYPIKNPVDPGIRFSYAFEEFEAAVAAGLDIYLWNSGFYPTELKAQVIAWHRLSQMVETHVEAARQEKSERLAQRARRKRR